MNAEGLFDRRNDNNELELMPIIFTSSHWPATGK